MSDAYDLVVVGGGSAGLTAAGFARQLGVRVALVERHRIGGDCTWSGCVPSKTLLKVAKVAHEMRTAELHGLDPVEPAVDMKRVRDRVRSVIADVYQHESPEALRADGIDVFQGDPRFVDPHTLAVNGSTLEARRVLLCTGAHPFVPPVAGLDGVNYLTYEELWEIDHLPGHLIVVGAGPIGSEMAQAFRRLGSKVTLVESGGQILSREEPEASQLLTTEFAKEGIDVRLNSKMERAWQDGNDIHVVAAGEELIGDALLVAVGRRPNVQGLELEKAGVAYTDRGIQVDDHLRTSQRHIYAAGDCIGSYQFTHYAGWQAFMAVRNAFLPGASRGVTDLVPWTTFTDPEVAHIGLTEAQAKERMGDEVMACDWYLDRVDRARAEGDTAGIIKLVHRRDGTLFGATIVAARAGEMIQEWVLAMDRGLKIGDLTNAIHVYPTYSTANMQVAADIRVGQLLSGTSGRIVRGLARLIR